jgi:NAD+ synthase (glutamine-hydrolysing)
VASELGSTHLAQDIDGVVAASVRWFTDMTGFTPSFTASTAENLALQNVQARVRMVQAYLAAQLLLTARGGTGGLLVLGSANVDEALRGFLTKYDCSSADLNPIGGVCKLDLRRFLRWAAKHAGYPALAGVADAAATPELVPPRLDGDGSPQGQVSEEDMGMSFEELGALGRLRKIAAQGPVGMFRSLAALWARAGEPAREEAADVYLPAVAPEAEAGDKEEEERRHPRMSVRAVAALVKRFTFFYSINRHKTTVLTPAYHAENYSPDDNRWTRQFAQIDALVEHMEDAGNK